jgi:hypothetical protein
LQRFGCAALIRGHDKIAEGFRPVYNDKNVLLCTLFSAGGEGNHDLPEGSGYRQVTPMALTIIHRAGTTQLNPWRIAYEHYNEPSKNGFYQREAELAFVGG